MSKILINDCLIELSPELLAEQFWNMDSEQQAKFYNHIAIIAKENSIAFQLQWITDEEGLSLGGRRVMQLIGHYSHWGLSPRAKKI